MCRVPQVSGGDPVKVRIEVTDVNDNSPVFRSEEGLLTIDIPENTPLGTTRQLPEAVDADDSGQLSYRIESGNDDGLFRLESESGGGGDGGGSPAASLELIVEGSLDRENQPYHDLQVSNLHIT